MRPVNLLPDTGTSRRRTLPGAPVLAAGAAPVVAAGLVYLGWSHAHAAAVERGNELAVVQAQVDALQPVAAEAAASAQLAAATSQRNAALRDVLSKQLPWDSTLDALARVLPADVWLTSLTLQSPTPAAQSSASSASAPQGVQLVGYARSQDAVARTLARLALVPGVSDVTLSSTASTTLGKTTVVQFTLGAAIAAGGAS
jgi:Tfp pilus assembly protein PilN